MDAAQCGLLVGVRPIIEYLATPFWHGMSDRYQYNIQRRTHGGCRGALLPPWISKIYDFQEVFRPQLVLSSFNVYWKQLDKPLRQKYILDSSQLY